MINVAILGFGTVGSGVAEVLTKNGALIDQRTTDLVRLKYIVDVRDFPDSPFAEYFVKDFSIVEDDAEIDIVIETIGGSTVALDFTTRSLMAGKSVVSSNKELVATHGYDLLRMAEENGANYLFEASVGGGIPILRPLTSCLAANQIEEVSGILNGTTNYILTRMIGAGLTFEQALKEAQDNGYAEKNPSADVDGDDTCRKICILAALCFGQHVYPQQVVTQGIREITLADVAYADSSSYKIKLLGRAIRQPDDKICAFVAPHLVHTNNPLSGVVDVFNAISVTGNAIGEVMFYGRGAGKLPTASAVVADVIDLAKNLNLSRHNAWGPGADDLVIKPDGMASRWYIRVETSMESARDRFFDISPLARGGAPESEVAFLTSKMTESEVREKLADLTIDSLIRVME